MPDSPLILLAEDELALAHIVRESLEGRNFKVILTADGNAAIQAYRNQKPDILILDIMMPEKDGFAVAKEIREHDTQTPIIFLTARSQAKDVVSGFELGANDYLKKPFSIEELIVRIQVQLNKGRLPENRVEKIAEEFEIGEFTFIPKKNLLTRGVETKVLTSRESELLKLLCLKQQEVLEREQILKLLWGSDNFFNARSLDVFITKLRRYLSGDPAVQIINIRGVGYKLVY